MPRNLWTVFASSIAFPLHERLKHHQTVSVRRALERSQWLPREQIETLQRERLRHFLVDISKHVPYYRELFRERGFDPQTVGSIELLMRLPPLTKADIRRHSERMLADNAGRVQRFNTGGSSGEPLIFYLGAERISHDVAAKWRATRWWDVDIGDPEIVLWGSPIELGSQDRIRAVRDRLLRSKLLPAFEMSEDKLRGFVHEIRRMRPKMLFGYPSALAHVAGFAKQYELRMDDLGIKVAFVTAEQLQEEQRARISSVFGCAVANGYGARDAGFIAHECQAGSMHICAEDIVVETLDPQGRPVDPGCPGEIVITHTATRAFPFVRYRTGDVGVLSDEPCACGRGLPILKSVLGRTTDFIVAQDGTVMHGLALIYILRDMPEVDSFKILQESRNLVRVQIVPKEHWAAEYGEHIEKGFARRLGKDVTIEIELVDSIPPEPSGKYRYVVSKVPADQVRDSTWTV